MAQSLAPEQIREIITSLQSMLGGQAAPERRRSPRYQRQALLEITPVGQTAGASAVLQDYSDHGLGLVYLYPLHKGQQFLAQWMHADGRKLEVLCQVSSCTQMDNGAFRIGAEFTS